MLRTLAFLSLLCFLVGCGTSSTATFTVRGATSASASFISLPEFAIPRVNIGTPTSFKITLYAAYISTNADCSSPVLLQDYGSAGAQLNMSASPTLFSGTPANGTYPCLILKFSDNMKFTADATAVATHAGCTSTTTEYTFDIYRDGESDDGNWIDINGNSIDATGSAASPGADIAYAFASTAPTTTKANGVSTNVNQQATLTGALTVPGQTTYYWDATNGISNHSAGASNYCWIEEVESGFR